MRCRSKGFALPVAMLVAGCLVAGCTSSAKSAIGNATSRAASAVSSATAGATGAVKTVKMSAKLVSGRQLPDE